MNIFQEKVKNVLTMVFSYDSIKEVQPNRILKIKEIAKMLTRKELESLGIKMTNEEWKNFCIQLSDIEEKMWEEDHPMDI